MIEVEDGQVGEGGQVRSRAQGARGDGAWLWPSWQLLDTDLLPACFSRSKERIRARAWVVLLYVQAEERHLSSSENAGKIKGLAAKAGNMESRRMVWDRSHTNSLTLYLSFKVSIFPIVVS